uniref:NAC-A/B domain-containing protein n=1 Tax=Eucampia antarctica TaxID=49252 RepID=A0A7S2SI79_9STRA|mmetsp:Transcript_8667/g.8245  ORF Transcript_8667/g.8245 Transcript_8667/m.8245 type:complete len:195 (+) Transcript_8667:95-679(+)|eukprot:CAMPEP_0197823148 /NCGR_PEP_ID=MMETSP1437-20131217/467_1 /TAXON_ID=49252 ORGANISM="Eucampia antarctica, Strain CCMP1452" /NCGR_SAMPLE_ID=MMETSP1437 /ASSEMBLY_ACC=CAM_ASM_001096 /LENGTH=194 /DNA_ID=CAMNT_0043422151 /DNA_START=61 /DNA_END=645 /DNA_ORIENTATION=-
MAAENEDIPQLEEVEDIPQLEEQVEDAAAGTIEADDSPRNRAEKKSRKMMQKMNMRPVPGVLRVTVKKSKNVLFVISKPDVYKSTNSDTYVVFGEAKSEDLGAAASQAAAAKQFRQPQAAGAAAVPAAPAVEELAEADIPELAAATEDAVDETGIEPKDIELVMSQAGCSRAKAVKALKENDGDLVNSIMSLTT